MLSLKDQTSRSCGFGQCLHSAVIEVPTPVKNDLLNSFFKALFCNEFSNLFCCLYIPRMFYTSLQLWTQAGDTDQGSPSSIFNGLGIDMFQASEDIEARPLRSSLDTTSYPRLPLHPRQYLLILQRISSLSQLGETYILGFSLSDLFPDSFPDVTDSLPFIRFRGFDGTESSG